MKILVTGFEPFGGEKLNPSWMAVERLPNQMNQHAILKKQLPVVYFKSLSYLENLIQEYQPDRLLLSGLAGDSDAIRIERVGINLCEASIPDNEGVLLEGSPIVKGGPCAYFSTFPYQKMLNAVKQEDIPVRFSYSAGAYLCNHVLYGALQLAHDKYPFLTSVGFIHVPSIPEQVKDGERFSLPLAKIAKAMEIFVKTMLE